MREEGRRRQLAAGIGARLGELWWAFTLRGMLAAVPGFCALIWPTVSLAVLLRLVGLSRLADGVAALIGAFRASERGGNLRQARIAALPDNILDPTAHGRVSGGWSGHA